MDLDPDIADSFSPEYASLDTRVTPLGKLVIFLPGANNVPADWHDHGRQLAGYGFHVLIPHYNNRWSSDGTCDGVGGNCYNDTRWEALTGEDTSTAIEIAPRDSVEGRVVALLQHLQTENPAGDWGFFLGEAAPLRYSSLIIAGISHGAASSGMYATRRPVTRCVMHSSGPAGDTAEAKMTPLSAWYSLTHTEDPDYDAISGSLQNWQIPGTPTTLDDAAFPFGESHQLITSAESTYPHCSTAVSSFSPVDANDDYLFDAAWRYLYGAPQP